MEIKPRSFESKILYFNGMYKLPIAAYPTTAQVIEHEAKRQPEQGWTDKAYLIRRLKDLKKILIDEVEEVQEIISQLTNGIKNGGGEYTELDCLTDLADWLTDLQVFEASEMAKFGLPVTECQNIVMSSNFSKLGADGKPLYDANGKVQKGPMYWKPEPQLKTMLAEYIEDAIANNKPRADDGIVWRNPPEGK